MTFLSAMGVLSIFVCTTILRGWVLSILWAWFVQVQFGLPGLGVAHAIGLSMLIGYMTGAQRPEVEDRKLSEQIALAICAPLMILLIGWVVKQFL